MSLTIREAIDASPFTDKALAEKLGMSQSEFSQKKNGWDGRRFIGDEVKTLAFWLAKVGMSFEEASKEEEIV